jgi:uncharacterized protein
LAIQLEADERGTILPVRAHAGARRNSLGGEHDGMLRVDVTQTPEKGKANKAIIAILAKQLGLRKNQISLISGETSRIKRFLIEEISPEKLANKLEDC